MNNINIDKVALITYKINVEKKFWNIILKVLRIFMKYPKPSCLEPTQGLCFKSVGNETC